MSISTGVFRNGYGTSYILSDVSSYTSMNIKVDLIYQYQPTITVSSTKNDVTIILFSQQMISGWGNPSIDKTIDIADYDNITISIDGISFTDDKYSYINYFNIVLQ